MKPLVDPFGRTFCYLRLSITDVCNFRCQYCLPNGYKRQTEEPELSQSEIRRIIHAFSEVGVWKIRITGGEPTVRSDFLDIANTISSIPNIRKVALTTNAFRLAQLAKDIKRAGISAVNISIDSLNPEQFHQVTGKKMLDKVLAGVDEALNVGLSPIKVNVVLLKHINDHELDLFLDWVRYKPVSVRFIELMQTSDNKDYFNHHHLSASVIRDRLVGAGWVRAQRESGGGPAVEFKHPEYSGSIGLIAPYSKDFCASCNRLRITSRGALRLCLFGTANHPLRHLLKSDSQKEELKEEIINLLYRKKASHFLHDGQVGNMANLSTVGG